MTRLSIQLLNINNNIDDQAVHDLKIRADLITLMSPQAIKTINKSNRRVIRLLLTTPDSIKYPRKATNLRATIITSTNTIVLNISNSIRQRILNLPRITLTRKMIITDISSVLRIDRFPRRMRIIIVMNTVRHVRVSQGLVRKVQTMRTQIIINNTLHSRRKTIPIDSTHILSNIRISNLLSTRTRLINAMLHNGILLQSLRLLRNRKDTRHLALLSLLTVLNNNTNRLSNDNLTSKGDFAGKGSLSIDRKTTLTLNNNMLRVINVLHTRHSLSVIKKRFLKDHFRKRIQVKFTLRMRSTSHTTLNNAKGSLVIKSRGLTTVSLVQMNTVIGYNFRTKGTLITARINGSRAVILGTVEHKTLGRRTKLITTILRILTLTVRNIARIISYHSKLILPRIIANIARLKLLNRLQINTTETLQAIRMRQDTNPAKAGSHPTRRSLVINRTNKFLITINMIVIKLGPNSRLIFTYTTNVSILRRLSIGIIQTSDNTGNLTMIKDNITTTVKKVITRRINMYLMIGTKVTLRRLTMLRLKTILRGNIPMIQLLVIRSFNQRLSILYHVMTRTIGTIHRDNLRRLLRAVNGDLILHVRVPRTGRITLHRLMAIKVVISLTIKTITANALIRMILILPVKISNIPVKNRIINSRVSSRARAVLVNNNNRFLRINFNTSRRITSKNIYQLMRMMPILNRLLTINNSFLSLTRQFNLRKDMTHHNGFERVLHSNLRQPRPYIRSNTILRILNRAMLIANQLREEVSSNILVTIAVNNGYNKYRARATRRYNSHRHSHYSLLPNLSNTYFANHTSTLHADRRLELVLVEELFSNRYIHRAHRHVDTGSRLALPTSLRLQCSGIYR